MPPRVSPALSVDPRDFLAVQKRGKSVGFSKRQGLGGEVLGAVPARESCCAGEEGVMGLLTSSSWGLMELSVYMHSFSAVRGIVSFSLEARNMHTAPSSCRWHFRVGTTAKNLSK